MASQFKNRLVGISILVASVVIFLPTIIDGKKTAYEDEFVSTPINPELKEHSQVRPENEPQPNGELAVATPAPIMEAEVSEEEWQVEEIASTVTVDKKEALIAKTTPKKPASITANQPKMKAYPKNAWTIQLGAFQNAANINALVSTLRNEGFQAHTIPTQVIDGQLTRVFVGPDVSKSKLEKQLPRLKKLTKLQGKLYPFDAVKP